MATHLRLRLFTRVLTPYVYALLVLFWSTYDTCTEMTLCAIICRLSCVHSCFNATPTLTLILTLALALALTLTLALILNPIYSLAKVSRFGVTARPIIPNSHANFRSPPPGASSRRSLRFSRP